MKIFLFLFVGFFIGSEAGLFGSSQHKNHSSSSNSQSSGLGLNPVGLIEDGIHKSAQGIGKPFTSVKDFAGSVLPKELTPEGLIEAWAKYKRDFKKSYSIQEEIPRRASFIKSYTDIVLHNLNFNKGFQTFKVGLNAFADASAAELKKLTSGVKLTPEILDRLKPSEKDLEEDAKYYGSLPQAGGLPTLRRKRAVSEPDAIDWREKGTVGPVKNQGFCGSCYAFSSLAALESLYKRTNHKYVPLSEQQLVDCSKSFGNEGCDGGLQENVYKFIQQHGAVKNETYRYTEEEGECKSNVELVTKVKGLVRVPKTEAALKKAVGLIGPVAISMDVGEPNFLHYSEGIYRTTNCSNTDLNHGMAVVGYGSDGPGKDFWIIRNSWGESWGLKGYMKLARNAKNMCGVATYAIYPKLK